MVFNREQISKGSEACFVVIFVDNRTGTIGTYNIHEKQLFQTKQKVFQMIQKVEKYFIYLYLPMRNIIKAIIFYENN